MNFRPHTTRIEELDNETDLGSPASYSDLRVGGIKVGGIYFVVRRMRREVSGEGFNMHTLCSAVEIIDKSSDGEVYQVTTRRLSSLGISMEENRFTQETHRLDANGRLCEATDKAEIVGCFLLMTEDIRVAFEELSQLDLDRDLTSFGAGPRTPKFLG